jgi:hypothetical protein
MMFTEKSAVKFIVTNLSDKSANEYFAQDKFQEFMNLIAQGREIAAAQQYQKVTGCRMKDCHFAAAIAKQLAA